MGSHTTILLVMVFGLMGITFLILFMALIRETLFWYWRTKGVMQQPQDILYRSHDTAMIVRKSIDGLKSAEAKSVEAQGAARD